MGENLLDELILSAALGDRPFRFFDQVGSTNDIAREWAQSGAPAGAIVIAEEQTTGRGRFGRSWVSPPGSALLFSVILRPAIDTEFLSRLTMLGAVAVSDALSALPNLPLDWIGLKWPNDVLLAGRKVAGILSEAVWDVEMGRSLEAVILGIGLNIRVDFTDTPLANQATSIERAIGTPVSRPDLLSKLLERIDYWGERLQEPVLYSRWRARLVTIGQRVVVSNWAARESATGPAQRMSGTVLDVDDDGTLLFQSDAGQVHRLIAGDVTMHGPDAE